LRKTSMVPVERVKRVVEETRDGMESLFECASDAVSRVVEFGRANPGAATLVGVGAGIGIGMLFANQMAARRRQSLLPRATTAIKDLIGRR
jgi:hypothetical protein